jgi:hypothetical protein
MLIRNRSHKGQASESSLGNNEKEDTPARPNLPDAGSSNRAPISLEPKPTSEPVYYEQRKRVRLGVADNGDEISLALHGFGNYTIYNETTGKRHRDTYELQYFLDKCWFDGNATERGGKALTRAKLWLAGRLGEDSEEESDEDTSEEETGRGKEIEEGSEDSKGSESILEMEDANGETQNEDRSPRGEKRKIPNDDANHQSTGDTYAQKVTKTELFVPKIKTKTVHVKRRGY